VTEAPRRPAADLIDAVVRRMKEQLEPLKYSTLVPGRYVVYVHPKEFERIRNYTDILREETARALDEELAVLNKPPIWRQYLEPVLGAPKAYRNPLGAWQVEFHEDPDGELGDGDIVIEADVLVKEDEPGAGQRTRRVTTYHADGRTTRREQTYTEPQGPASWSSSPSTPTSAVSAPSRVHARLTFDDDAGHHVFDIVRDSTTIGRGGIAYPVDVRIQASVDVSREHIRIRRDPATSQLFVVDLSSLGTTLDGRPLPRGYDEVDGTKKENKVETPLPRRGRLGLADTVFIDFEVTA
jgi:hypothetical protein